MCPKRGSASSRSGSSDDGREEPNLPKKKRSNFAPEQIQVLRGWAHAHKDKCYPTEVEKEMLAKAADMNTKQVSDWFINFRARILPGLLENGVPPPEPVPVTPPPVKFTHAARKQRKPQISVESPAIRPVNLNTYGLFIAFNPLALDQDHNAVLTLAKIDT